MERIMRFLRGYLQIRISGGSPERFLNLCANHGFFIWNISGNDENYIFYMFLSDFWKIRKDAKKTGIKIKILKRQGFPFGKKLYIRKIGFVIGFLIYCFILYQSDLRIWNYKINGNYHISEEQLKDYIYEKGMKPFTRKSKVSVSEIERELRERFEQITWVCAKYEGNILEINLKENVNNGLLENNVVQLQNEDVSDTDTKDNMEGMKNQNSIYADEDGIIRYMIVRNGTPRVSVNSIVSRGDLLVDGDVEILNEDGTVRELLHKMADADIIIESQRTYYDELSKIHIVKEYTGREKKRMQYRLGDYFRQRKPVKTYLYEDQWESIEEFFGIPLLPFTVQKYTLDEKEYQNWVREYTYEEAQEILKQNLKEFIESLEGKGVQIIEKDVKITEYESLYCVEGMITVRHKVKDN